MAKPKKNDSKILKNKNVLKDDKNVVLEDTIKVEDLSTTETKKNIEETPVIEEPIINEEKEAKSIKGSTVKSEDNSIDKKYNEALADLAKEKEKVTNLEISNVKLKFELDSERRNLITKIQEKSSQAQLLIDEKINELEEKKKVEISELKNKIFEDVICKFIDPVLLLEKTVSFGSTNPAINNYLQGFNMIIAMFNDKLKDLGVKEIDVKIGDEFNELYMEAFEVIENSGMKSDRIVEIINGGYVFDNRVLKHVLVKVSK